MAQRDFGSAFVGGIRSNEYQKDARANREYRNSLRAKTDRENQNNANLDEYHSVTQQLLQLNAIDPATGEVRVGLLVENFEAGDAKTREFFLKQGQRDPVIANRGDNFQVTDIIQAGTGPDGKNLYTAAGKDENQGGILKFITRSRDKEEENPNDPVHHFSSQQAVSRFVNDYHTLQAKPGVAPFLNNINYRMGLNTTVNEGRSLNAQLQNSVNDVLKKYGMHKQISQLSDLMATTDDPKEQNEILRSAIYSLNKPSSDNDNHQMMPDSVVKIATESSQQIFGANTNTNNTLASTPNVSASTDVSAPTSDPEALFKAVRQVESGGDPAAVSSAGAVGTMQTMPDTLKDPGFGVTPAQDNSPEELERVGRDYLNAMVSKYDNVEHALVAYNWGPTNADKWIKEGADKSKLPKETSDYINKVNALLPEDKPSLSSQPTTSSLIKPTGAGEGESKAFNIESSLNEPDRFKDVNLDGPIQEDPLTADNIEPDKVYSLAELEKLFGGEELEAYTTATPGGMGGGMVRSQNAKNFRRNAIRIQDLQKKLDKSGANETEFDKLNKPQRRDLDKLNALLDSQKQIIETGLGRANRQEQTATKRERQPYENKEISALYDRLDQNISQGEAAEINKEINAYVADQQKADPNFTKEKLDYVRDGGNPNDYSNVETPILDKLPEGPEEIKAYLTPEIRQQIVKELQSAGITSIQKARELNATQQQNFRSLLLEFSSNADERKRINDQFYNVLETQNPGFSAKEEADAEVSALNAETANINARTARSRQFQLNKTSDASIASAITKRDETLFTDAFKLLDDATFTKGDDGSITEKEWVKGETDRQLFRSGGGIQKLVRNYMALEKKFEGKELSSKDQERLTSYKSTINSILSEAIQSMAKTGEYDDVWKLGDIDNIGGGDFDLSRIRIVNTDGAGNPIEFAVGRPDSNLTEVDTINATDLAESLGGKDEFLYRYFVMTAQANEAARKKKQTDEKE